MSMSSEVNMSKKNKACIIRGSIHVGMFGWDYTRLAVRPQHLRNTISFTDKPASGTVVAFLGCDLRTAGLVW